LREHPFRRVSIGSLTSGNVCYLWENHPEIEPLLVTRIWSQVAENGSGNDVSGAVLPGSGGGI